MSTTVAQFEIPYYQFLNASGEVVAPLPEFASDTQLLVDLYRTMVTTRLFDQKAINLQRTGKMGTYAAILGQEAIGTAIGSALDKDDVLVAYYRDYAAQFQRGVKMSEIYGYWGGDERASNFEVGGKDFPICVPIASQCLHATGIATAFKLRGENRVVSVAIGEGGTSEGDFYEAINVAGCWNLPVMFTVNNNQWAISVPRSAQTGCETFAQKAIAAGIPGIQVDGNDLIAVRHAANEAIARARRGEGATLIEAVTYRLSDHTTADDASRYREQVELDEAWEKEPIKRLKIYLESLNVWDDTAEQALLAEAKEKVDAAVDEYINKPPEPPTAMFDSLYETLPEALVAQREEAERFHEEHHGH